MQNKNCKKCGRPLDIKFASLTVDLELFSVTCPKCKEVTTAGKGMYYFTPNGLGIPLASPGPSGEYFNTGTIIKKGDAFKDAKSIDEKIFVNLLSHSEYTTEILHKIQHVTEVAQKEKYTPEKYKQEIASIGVPDTFLKLIIPENAGEFYGFLSFLATVIFGILALRATKNTMSKSPKSTKKYKNLKTKNSNKNKVDIETHKLRREYRKNKR